MNDTTANADDIYTLNNYTSGVVNAETITTLTGALSAVNAAYAANTAGTIENLEEAATAVELTDTTALADDLNTLNGYSDGSIDASTVTVIEGTASALNELYDAKDESNGFNGTVGSESVTLTDTTVDASALVDLDSSDGTSGTIHASSVHTIEGSMEHSLSVYA